MKKIDKKSEEYKQGFKDGVTLTCNHLIDVSHKFKRNIFDLVGLMK